MFLATGLVDTAGNVSFTQGPVPTVTHPSAGTYGFTISGVGSGCPLPQLTLFEAGAAPTGTIFFGGGACGGGTITTTVFMGSGTDQYWSYMLVGDPPSGAAPVQKRVLPAR